MSEVIIPVILCGGSGSRLWPLSRRSFPKQFLSLDLNNKSLLQNTISRLVGLKNCTEPILVCNEDHRFIVAEQMREINVKPKSIILEPFGRNTAPAISIAALKALEFENDPTLLVLSSDHVIKNNDNFIKVVKESLKWTHQKKLITFGIIPNSPHTGYGYIEGKNPFLGGKIEGSIITKFIEKPNEEKAKEFFNDKKYSWNSGIFMFKAITIIEELKTFCPEILSNSRQSLEKKLIDLDFERLEKSSFKKCPSLSIDIAIMEKTKKGMVFPLDAGWNDVGSWESLWEISDKTSEGNVIEGNVISKETKNCFIKSENRLVVSLGIKDLIIVETNDAILICSKESSQKIKNIVEDLKAKNIPEGEAHKTIYRPWGQYTSLVEDGRWQVKLIKVNPGERLSQQMHHHRAEHWIVVGGTAKVEIDEKEKILTENQSAYIPLGSIHRLTNPGKIPLSLIEVQSGAYLGEDDIQRFEDNYGRLREK